MRLRIRRKLTGSIDGVPLDRFRAGGVYEVGTQLANVFLAEGWAEPVAEDGAARRIAALVLVVDDETRVRRLTTRLLTGKGYEAVEAGDGREAIARLCEHSPDLVLLDLYMPFMDGWQFRAEQQRLPDRRLAAIPVLLLTGAGGAVDHAKTLKAVGLVRKPFYPERLLGAVKKALPS
jgi:chemosensory pili system protein ChpA (sensor histidine kinase/response regulator)